MSADPTTEAGRRWLAELNRDVQNTKCPECRKALRRTTTTRKRGDRS